MYQWSTLVRQKQIEIGQVIVGEIKEQRVITKQGGRLEEQESTNGPNVSYETVVMVECSHLIQKVVVDSDEP